MPNKFFSVFWPTYFGGNYWWYRFKKHLKVSAVSQYSTIHLAPVCLGEGGRSRILSNSAVCQIYQNLSETWKHKKWVNYNLEKRLGKFRPVTISQPNPHHRVLMGTKGDCFKIYKISAGYKYHLFYSYYLSLFYSKIFVLTLISKEKSKSVWNEGYVS